jgi:hypothetical protein
MADRQTILRASIQRRALALVLPLVIASMLSIGLVSFHTLNKQTAKRIERFLHDRHNEILTISEDQSVANYFHNIAYGLSEEATLYKKELERYFKRFSDRYNSIDQIYAGIRYIDKKGHEIAKFWEGRIGGEYHSVIDEPFFQSAMELSAWTVYTSPLEPRMINATPIYWDEDGNGELSDDELRGVIAVDFLYRRFPLPSRAVSSRADGYVWCDHWDYDPGHHRHGHCCEHAPSARYTALTPIGRCHQGHFLRGPLNRDRRAIGR